MAGHTATACYDTTGDCHTTDILRACLHSYKKDILSFCSSCFSILSIEVDLSAGSTRRSVKALSIWCDVQVSDDLVVKNRSEELGELICWNSGDSCLLVDETLLHHFNLASDPAEDCSLTISGLEHEELAFLDCELQVLHIVIVLLELLSDIAKLSVGFWVNLLKSRYLLRSPDTCNNIFTLGIHQVFAEELVLTCGWVTCEGDTCTAGLTHVSEDHGLDVDSCSQQSSDVVHKSVLDGSFIIPAVEYSVDGLEELISWILREVFACVFLVDDLISLDDFLQVIYIKFCVKCLAVLILNRLECILELCMWNTHYNVSEHLDETSVAVPGESLVSCLLDKCIKGIWIKTKVKDSIHHAWHGLGCTGTDRNKKRILLVTKLCSHKVLKSY